MSARTPWRLTAPRASAGALPSAPQYAEPWRLLSSTRHCTRSDRPSATKIQLVGNAEAQLVDVVIAKAFAESGGLLFGHADHGLIAVEKVTGPGAKAIHGARVFKPDVDHDLSLVAQMRESGLTCVGSFHSHVEHGDAEPSSDDLDFWSGWRQALEVERFAALVVVRLRDGWCIEPFVIRPGVSRDLCEPAVVNVATT